MLLQLRKIEIPKGVQASMKKGLFFLKVGKTRIIPLSVKLVSVFVVLLLLSNFATNFINLQMNQRQITILSNKILVSQLKDIYTVVQNQYKVYEFSKDIDSSLQAIEMVSRNALSYENSIVMGARPGASSFFSVAYEDPFIRFPDELLLLEMKDSLSQGIDEGSIRFSSSKGNYFGVYKYSPEWNVFIIRADLIADVEKSTNRNFIIISAIIILFTILFLFAGLVMFSKILASISTITKSLYKMQQEQKLSLLDLSNSSNDDISYLAASFNSLSTTINNLLGIFQKFVSKDVVEAAYKEHSIRLEGSQKDLAILFSDIRGFTYMTETLGNDIINLLNIHYDKAIAAIHEENGIIGSIIGDAILSVYGAMGSYKNNSLEALRSAWQITRVTASLREQMIERRKEIEKQRPLTEAEERVFQAVLIDVGVGLDGGKVFYGNIGSFERMTNTVIGDNVNSAARLEGLTRLYKVPVIASDYIKEGVESVTSQFTFIELDTVQVKGKTEGKKIYFPLDSLTTDAETLEKYAVFSEALSFYYKGDWTEARKLFRASKLELARVFLDRITIKQAPKDWSGIWEMTTK
jgi:class 3 adenylate cyclase